MYFLLYYYAETACDFEDCVFHGDRLSIEAHPELRSEETEDMFDYFNPEHDWDDDEDEYE